MNDTETAKFLGVFSLGLSALEILCGRGVRRAFGLRNSAGLVRVFAAREFAAGAMIRQV